MMYRLAEQDAVLQTQCECAAARRAAMVAVGDRIISGKAGTSFVRRTTSYLRSKYIILTR